MATQTVKLKLFSLNSLSEAAKENAFIKWSDNLIKNPSHSDVYKDFKMFVDYLCEKYGYVLFNSDEPAEYYDLYDNNSLRLDEDFDLKQCYSLNYGLGGICVFSDLRGRSKQKIIGLIDTVLENESETGDKVNKYHTLFTKYFIKHYKKNIESLDERIIGTNGHLDIVSNLIHESFSETLKSVQNDKIKEVSNANFVNKFGNETTFLENGTLFNIDSILCV